VGQPIGELPGRRIGREGWGEATITPAEGDSLIRDRAMVEQGFLRGPD